MSTLEQLHQRKSELEALANRYGVSNIRVFGSVAREQETEESDVDFLIRMESGRTLTDLCAFRLKAKEMLGREVYLVDETMLHPLLKESIMSEATTL